MRVCHLLFGSLRPAKTRVKCLLAALLAIATLCFPFALDDVTLTPLISLRRSASPECLDNDDAVTSTTGATCSQLAASTSQNYCATHFCANCPYAGYCDLSCGVCPTNTPTDQACDDSDSCISGIWGWAGYSCTIGASYCTSANYNHPDSMIWESEINACCPATCHSCANTAAPPPICNFTNASSAVCNALDDAQCRYAVPTPAHLRIDLCVLLSRGLCTIYSDLGTSRCRPRHNVRQCIRW